MILAAAIGLPVGPVIADYFGPATTARWMLAKAANEFDQGNVVEAQKLLEDAYKKSPDIAADRNFLKQLDRLIQILAGWHHIVKAWRRQGALSFHNQDAPSTFGIFSGASTASSPPAAPGCARNSVHAFMHGLELGRMP